MGNLVLERIVKDHCLPLFILPPPGEKTKANTNKAVATSGMKHTLNVGCGQ